MQSRSRKRRLILSSDIESEDGGTHLPPSDPPSDSSDDDAGGGTVQTSDDIPLMGLLRSVEYNPHRQLNMTGSFAGQDSPNLATPHARGRRFRPRSSSLPIPDTPWRSVHHALGLEHRPLLAPNFGLITPRTQKRLNYSAGQQKRRDTLARQRIEAEERREAEKRMHEENECMRKTLFLDEVAEILQEKLTERGYSLADFLDHVFNPDRKFAFDWRWKGFFAHKVTVRRILEYWTTSKYSQTARTVVLDFATSLVERTVGRESRRITQSEILQKRKKIVNEEFFLKYSLSDLTNSLRQLAPRMFQILDAFSTTRRQVRDLSPAWFKKKNLVRLLFDQPFALI
jgi:hypothetical protein